MLRMTMKNNTKIVDILRKNEKRRGWANNENILKSILERHLTDEIHSYVNFQKDLRITPGKLEESGKILGKTCGLGPTEKKNTVEKGFLKRWWCTGTTEGLEWGDNLELIEYRRTRIWTTPNTCIESTGKEKGMKNVERNENSPIEIIEERLKRFRTNEIDAPKRLRLRE